MELPKKVGEGNNCKCTIMNQQVTECSHAEKKKRENYGRKLLRDDASGDVGK